MKYIIKVVLNVIAIILGVVFIFTGGTDVHLGLGALLVLVGINNIL